MSPKNCYGWRRSLYCPWSLTSTVTLRSSLCDFCEHQMWQNGNTMNNKRREKRVRKISKLQRNKRFTGQVNKPGFNKSHEICLYYVCENRLTKFTYLDKCPRSCPFSCLPCHFLCSNIWVKGSSFNLQQ